MALAAVTPPPVGPHCRAVIPAEEQRNMLDPTLVMYLSDFLGRHNEWMMGEVWFGRSFPVQSWADALGCNVMRRIKVVGQDARTGNRYVFEVVPDDAHWKRRLEYEAATRCGASGVTFVPALTDGPSGIQLLSSTRELTIKCNGLGVCRIEKPPPLAIKTVRDTSAVFLEPTSPPVPVMTNAPIGVDGCPSCAVRDALAEAKTAVRPQMEAFRQKLVKTCCSALEGRKPAEVDHVSATRTLIRAMHSPDVYAKVGPGQKAYHSFWRSVGVANPGLEVTSIASAVGASVCKIASGLSASRQEKMDSSVLSQGLHEDSKLWHKIEDRWVEHRAMQRVGSRRPLPPSLAQHEQHGKAHGLPARDQRIEMIQSMNAARIEPLRDPKPKPQLSQVPPLPAAASRESLDYARRKSHLVASKMGHTTHHELVGLTGRTLPTHTKRVEASIQHDPLAHLPLIACPHCGGEGDNKSELDELPLIECEMCKEIGCNSCGGKKKQEEEEFCAACHGLTSIECNTCGGKKKKKHSSPAAEPTFRVQQAGPHIEEEEEDVEIRVFNGSDGTIEVSIAEDPEANLVPRVLVHHGQTGYCRTSRSRHILIVPGAKSVGLATASRRSTLYVLPKGEVLLMKDEDSPTLPGMHQTEVRIVNLRSHRVEHARLVGRLGHEVSFGPLGPRSQTAYRSIATGDYVLHPGDIKVSLKHRNHHSIVLLDANSVVVALDSRHERQKMLVASQFFAREDVAKLVRDRGSSGLLMAPSDAHHAASIGAPLSSYLIKGEANRLLQQKNVNNNVSLVTAEGHQLVFNDHMSGVFDRQNKQLACHGVFPHPENRNLLVAVVDGSHHDFPKCE